jgi:hypothetical protein
MVFSVLSVPLWFLALCSAVMIQRDKLVGEWHVRRLQIAQGIDDVACPHVLLAIGFFVNDEESGMMSAGTQYEFVKGREVPCVSSHEGDALRDSIKKVHRVVIARATQGPRRNESVRPGSRQPNEQVLIDIIVQVADHGVGLR